MTESACRVLAYLESKGYADRVHNFKNLDVTADSTAVALGVDSDRVCKGLAFKGKGGSTIVLMAAGKARVDNHLFKECLGVRPTMIPSEQCSELVGHIAGTINPFCLAEGAKLYLDLSIREHINETIFTGIGDVDSAVELTVDELEKLTNPICWVKVTK